MKLYFLVYFTLNVAESVQLSIAVVRLQITRGFM